MCEIETQETLQDNNRLPCLLITWQSRARLIQPGQFSLSFSTIIEWDFYLQGPVAGQQKKALNRPSE